MKKSVIIGSLAGFAVGAVAAVAGKIAVDKVVGEIKQDLGDNVFTSPEGNNTVTLSYGSSDTAKGLTYVKVRATAEGKEDDCKLVIFTKKKNDGICISGEWVDNGQFKLLIGSGKRKQCCDVTFGEEQISAVYYLQKN
jgi:hypothetical protein